MLHQDNERPKNIIGYGLTENDFKNKQINESRKNRNERPYYVDIDSRQEFLNFKEFENHYCCNRELINSQHLSNAMITLQEQSSSFNIILYFPHQYCTLKQIQCYKTILNNLERLKSEIYKIKKILTKNKIYNKATIILSPSYNEIFPYWASEENKKNIACYYLNTVYLFGNEKQKKSLTKKEVRESLFHEFGHMIEEKLYYGKENQNKYSSLIRQDFKLAIKKKTSLVLTNKRDEDFYNHVAPPTQLIRLRKEEIMNHDTTGELFAESFAYYLDFNHKRTIRSKNVPILNEMFPHTNYIVKQTCKGKSVNKYKVFGQKKITKIIKF